jgi:methyl-accepting chemotaxis protein
MNRLIASTGARHAAGLLLLGLVALGAAAAGWVGMRVQAERDGAIARLAAAEPIADRLPTGVYAVVMASRGLYLARDRAQAERFAASSTLRAGSEVKVAFPGLPPITARVARTGEGVLAVAFRQDRDSLARIDAVLARLGPAKEAA